MKTTTSQPRPPGHLGHASGLEDPLRALALALGVTLILMGVEAIGGWLTGSLALLADAGHLFVDVGVSASESWDAGSPRGPPPPRCPMDIVGPRSWRP